MTTSSESVTEQTQYVEPDLIRYDVIDAEELQERRRLDPLVQETFDELAWMKSDDAQVQYRKDMIELEYWRKKYDIILPDLEELEERRKVEREAQAELNSNYILEFHSPYHSKETVRAMRQSQQNYQRQPEKEQDLRQQSSYYAYYDPRATDSYCNQSWDESEYS